MPLNVWIFEMLDFQLSVDVILNVRRRFASLEWVEMLYDRRSCMFFWNIMLHVSVVVVVMHLRASVLYQHEEEVKRSECIDL